MTPEQLAIVAKRLGISVDDLTAAVADIIEPRRVLDLTLVPTDPSDPPLTAEEGAIWDRELASLPTGILGNKSPFMLRHYQVCGVNAKLPDAVVVLRPFKDEAEPAITSRAISSIFHSSRIRRWEKRVDAKPDEIAVDKQIVEDISVNPSVTSQSLIDRYHVGDVRLMRVARAAGWTKHGNSKKVAGTGWSTISRSSRPSRRIPRSL